MGKRDFRMCYREARRQADREAKALADGYEVKSWHDEPAWLTGQPEPPKVYLEGAAWVA